MRVTFDDFTFDSHLRTLTRNDRSIALTPKTFALLDLLMSAAPKPLSRNAIYEALWPGVFVEPGNLHNLINELRSALGDSGHTLIKTVYRVGYAFVAPLTLQRSIAPRLQIGDDSIELVEGATIIGRESLGTPDASRRHARITVSGSDVTIEDLGSKNGTFVRGERIRTRTSLRDGDEIVFGRTRARLQITDPDAGTITAP